MKRVEPGPGQESVWDYPRPPRLEDCDREIKVVFAGQTIVETTNSKRVLETSHPPVYYVPVQDARPGVLLPSDRRTFCEWKGVAHYFHVRVGESLAENAAWGYDQPSARFSSLRDHVAIYAHLMDACYVDGEQVQSQLGGFYGGWVTKDIAGPFKGAPGTRGW
jgi:uncharacterized protein (DUF427 family)